jgi:hypothetical protein
MQQYSVNCMYINGSSLKCEASIEFPTALDMVSMFVGPEWLERKHEPN